MERNLRIRKTFQIEYRDELYTISLNENEVGVIMNDFKPPEFSFHSHDSLLVSEDKFLNVWVKYIIGLYVCREKKDIIERNIGALTFITMDHVEQFGNIDSKTFFKFMDCFSNVLYSDGLAIKEIRKIYLPVAKSIIECFGEKVIDSETGCCYMESGKFQLMKSLINE